MELLPNGLFLKQQEGFLKIGTDAVLLAGFVKPAPRAKVCDLGCGAGAVTFLLADVHPHLLIDGVEIQEDAAQLASETVELNRLGHRIRIFAADLRNLSGLLEGKTYDEVVCNPPYYKQNAGPASLSTRRRIECIEETASIDDICKAASGLLRDGGNLTLIYPTVRLTELVRTMTLYCIEPKRLRMIHANPDKPSKLCLISGKRSAKPGLVVEPPLILNPPYKQGEHPWQSENFMSSVPPSEISEI